VVVSSEIRPYIMALNGLRERLDSPFGLYYLKDNHKLVIHRLRNDDRDAVVYIGPEAARLLKDGGIASGVNIVLMVLEPDKLLGDPHLCGVDLRVPLEVQFDRMVKRFGKGVKVGVLYDPGENGELVKSAETEAVMAGLELRPLPVASRKEVGRVLEMNLSRIDILWFIPDSTVISEAVVGYLIKTALLQGVASVGYNHFFMERGAVMSFTVDYEEVGRYGAAMVRQAVRGDGCSLVPPPFRVEWNEKAWRIVLSRRKR